MARNPVTRRSRGHPVRADIPGRSTDTPPQLPTRPGTASRGPARPGTAPPASGLPVGGQGQAFTVTKAGSPVRRGPAGVEPGKAAAGQSCGCSWRAASATEPDSDGYTVKAWA